MEIRHNAGPLITVDGNPAGDLSPIERGPGEERAVGGGALALEAALEGLHLALQEPAADVMGALLRLSPFARPPDAEVMGMVEAVLYHGHGAELAAWIPLVLPPAATARLEAEVVHDGLTLREIGCELALDRVAATPAPVDLLALLRALRPLTDLPLADLCGLVEQRQRLAPEALRRAGYRYDRPGHELVPLLCALTARFGHLLGIHWGWPPARALLAMREILALLLARADPRFDLEGMHACRECVMALPGRVDLSRGASATSVDPNVVLLTWPQRLALPGGPFRSAALLEALPLWAQFLEALRLVDRVPAQRLRATCERLGSLLGPSLSLEASRRGDRALAAAARRLSAGRPRAS